MIERDVLGFPLQLIFLFIHITYLYTYIKFISGFIWYKCIDSFVNALIKSTSKIGVWDNKIYDASSVV